MYGYPVYLQIWGRRLGAVDPKNNPVHALGFYRALGSATPSLADVSPIFCLLTQCDFCADSRKKNGASMILRFRLISFTLTRLRRLQDKYGYHTWDTAGNMVISFLAAINNQRRGTFQDCLVALPLILPKHGGKSNVSPSSLRRLRLQSELGARSPSSKNSHVVIFWEPNPSPKTYDKSKKRLHHGSLMVSPVP